MPHLQGIRACVFDAYGTLFDYNAAAERCKDALAGNLDRLSALWREKQLQYAWLRSLQGKHADFWQITGDALDYAMESIGVVDGALRQRLMNLYLTLDAYPDAADVLTRLKSNGFATAILSNGSPPMLEAAIANARIGDLLDAVISVEEVGIYKPHPSVYQLAVDRFDVAPGAILFLSSNAWDAYAASAFGMRAIWCNRSGQPRERLPGQPEREIKSLAELPALLSG